VGVRQTINENPALSTGVTIGVIVLALLIILWEAFGSHRHRPLDAGRAFYSDDDGQTWFADVANKRTPFTDANNKPAVQALVFKCGGQPFVGYLLRSTISDGDPAAAGPPRTRGLADPSNTEVKKPRAKTWVRFDPRNSAPYASITQTFPQCPSGRPEPVLPAP
jgi:hypothetical protein